MEANKTSYFVVEGNIGAGKSTFVSLIKKYLDIQVVLEPLDQWQQIGKSGNLLEKFYEDTPRWAYTFQSYAFVTRVRAQKMREKQYPYVTQIVERSVYSDRYCFAKNCYELGFMNALEWKLYQEWFSWLVDNYTTLPNGFIYLQVTPDICYQRLVNRNRKEDASVSLAYLQSLHDKHEKWLVKKEGLADQISQIPVLVINANQEFEADMHVQKELMTQVASFMQNTPDYTVHIDGTSQHVESVV